MKLVHITLLFLCVVLSTHAQNLTVRDIMAEPSIAGMRVEGEKLSPDGKWVIFLWNAEGKQPRDLYLVATTGGDPVKILSTSDLPAPSRPPEKENKLDYGVTVRDDFVKARENQLGGFEWSPDSNRLVFSYGGDLYILGLNGPADLSKWPAYQSAMERRADLIANFVSSLKNAGIQEPELIASILESRSRLLNAINSRGQSSLTAENIQAILHADKDLNEKLYSADTRLRESYPQLRSNDAFMSVADEMLGVSNRIKTARGDFEKSQARSPRRLTRTQAAETGARFLDTNRILYSQSGNLFIWDVENGLITQVSRESNPQAFISVFNATPNKPGTLIAYVVSDSSKNKALVVPNFLDEFVVANTTRRGWTDSKVVVAPADGSRDTPFEIKLPKAEGVSNIRRMVWAADNSSLIIDRVDKDTKRRQLFYVYNVGSKGEKIIPIIEETDDKWQAALSSIFEANPKDSSELFFGSEKDGFNHLYLAKLEAETRAVASVSTEAARVAEGPPGLTGKVTTTQLTKGNWQVEWAKWTDGQTIAYASTQPTDPGTSLLQAAAERELFLLRKETGKVIARVYPKEGMRSGFQISETADVPMILFEGSRWNQPGELYVERMLDTGAPPVQLTKTTPDSFSARKWTEPKFLEIPSRDNKKIPAKIYLPAGFNAKAKQKYPMVIFVHGAGYLQNVINGWNNYYREFMFNELLVQKGYVVLDIDYRGSAGYGRDWRTDVYDFLGGKDFDDHIDSIDYMVKNYNVNQSKIGTYGGSYGGFMAGMLVTRAPERIAAAAALRPVFDWKNYYASSPGYTAQRLGFPDKNPEAYKRSSPITYADQLQRPLLILHGMSDDNVHVQDSIQMMEKLIRLGKTQYFETMLYPSENHGFVRPESWTDEYERILGFFEKHLR